MAASETGRDRPHNGWSARTFHRPGDRPGIERRRGHGRALTTAWVITAMAAIAVPVAVVLAASPHWRQSATRDHAAIAGSEGPGAAGFAGQEQQFADGRGSESAAKTRPDKPWQNESVAPATSEAPAASGHPGEERVARNAVLVTVSLSAPKSLDDEIARDHGMTIMDRLNVLALNSRVIRYRIPDGRSLEDVMAALRADRRVGTFQPNMAYEAPREPEAVPEPQRIAKHAKEPPPAARLPADIDSPVRPGARQQPVDQIVFADTAQSAAARDKTRAKPSRLSSNSSGSRWPSPDEPFIEIGPTRF